jgi:hypothetical protein
MLLTETLVLPIGYLGIRSCQAASCECEAQIQVSLLIIQHEIKAS